MPSQENAPGGPSARTRVLASATAAALAIAALSMLTREMLRLTGGVVSYPLDDTFIHLALADQLANGWYGVQAGTHAAPSSSLAYPFLLALLAPVGQASALWLAGAGLAATAAALADTALVFVFARTRWGAALAACFGFTAAVACGQLATAQTGLEHTWHAFAVAVVMRGLLATETNGVVPRGLVFGVVACVALRYEGLAVAACAIAWLALAGHRHAARNAALLALGMLLVHAGMLVALGLPAVPSSVLLKSGLKMGGGGPELARPLLPLARNLASSLLGPEASTLLRLSAAAFALRFALAERTNTGARRASALVVASIGAHMLLGRSGTAPPRYEAYLLVLATVAALAALGPPVTRLAAERPRLLGVAVVLAPLWLSPGMLRATVLLPRASQAIERQHHTLHRFATEVHRGPVAVNDLGWVSYQNPYPVLDLWGLGTEEARRLHAMRDPDEARATIARLARDHEVEVAMVYASWFEGRLPSSWVHVARLRTVPSTYSGPGASEVDFFATNAASVPRLMRELDRLEGMLGSRVTLERVAR